MVVTRLSDAIIPAVFVPYMLKETMTKTAIFQSGILRQDAQLSNFLSGGGQTVNVPFWNDLADSSTANISSDDPAVTATLGQHTQHDRAQRGQPYPACDDHHIPPSR